MPQPAHSLDPRHPATSPHDLYMTKPPWDIDRPQAAFTSLAAAGNLQGRVLDAGCGTGEHALLAAGLGCDAVGVDLSADALDTAQRKARERGLVARFVRHDACALPELGEQFDTVLDSGLFHIFTGTDRTRYTDSLHAVIRPGGGYFLLGFSDAETRQWGPHRLSRDEITAAFATGWQIDAIEPSVIEINGDPGSVAAWLVALTRK
ncbi:class I SAM-dependent methyltransferase [Skermania sp. ID1734]|uniref:class I SAM-dependent methyltransferase n=1 Tax=Skermania sp. ID1734 TaxID=2597516 RepID=UPI00117D7FAC|nr:class I SAM-dependent methyltransferase [Skermania sp. ID1734]TSD93768.1 class I SAM-dependent methyltransferase [Skermania sp. ID1734]